MHITPPFPTRVINAVSMWWFRLTERFFRLNLPQPDLTDEPLELVTAVIRGINTLGDEEVEETEMVIFTNYPDDLAFKQGWGKTIYHFMNLGDTAFALRYPNHPRSKAFRDLTPSVTGDELRQMLRGH